VGANQNSTFATTNNYTQIVLYSISSTENLQSLTIVLDHLKSNLPQRRAALLCWAALAESRDKGTHAARPAGHMYAVPPHTVPQAVAYALRRAALSQLGHRVGKN
jgi:hypothetical protein